MSLNIDVGNEEGQPCRRNGCNGTIREADHPGGCTCFINPPCSACTTDRTYCDVCDWTGEEEARAYWQNMKAVEVTNPKPAEPSAISSYRTTVSILADGQPRRYADGERHVRVEFEQLYSLFGIEIEWRPCRMRREVAIMMLAGNPQAGFVNRFKDTAGRQWYDSFCSLFQPLDAERAHPNDATVTASKWEFIIITPYTD